VEWTRSGESLSSVQKFDVPLDQATTNSLEALNAFTLGRKAMLEKGDAEAIPFFKRAVELDPNFAWAYAFLGINYSNLNQPSLAADYFRKAFALRDRVTEREKFGITWLYYANVTGELDLSAQQGQLSAAELQKILDHRGQLWNCATGAVAHLGLARAYVLQGDTAKARAAYQDFLALWKDADLYIPILKQAEAEYAKVQ
jgi:tetratricopeptide (TPR) repeat protein